MAFPIPPSFAPLGTIHLPTPSILLQGACNPVMDLVAIPTAGTHPQAFIDFRNIKGKGRASDVGEKRIGLWRMSGAKVWDVSMEGDLAGLAWSLDGLYLSILTSMPSGEYQLQHLSVHDGTVVHSLTMDGDLIGDTSKDLNGWDWDLEWIPVDAEWPIPENGSGRMIVDLLPRVTPVEPPKPTNPLLLMMQNANKAKPKTAARHSKLASFPCLLPQYSSTPPQALRLIPPRPKGHHELLTGTFNVIRGLPTDKLLVLPEIGNRLCGFNDVVLRGTDNAEAAFKEGSKQTLIWREELETCGEQQGMTVKDVHADLLRFLMTGRSGPAVQEWLGNRLTGRVLTKWSDTLDSSLRDISKVIVESIQPALERIVILLDELNGLIQSLGYGESRKASVVQTRDITRGMIILTETIRRKTRLQLQAVKEWFAWLQYEIARATSTDPSQEGLPTANYDLKLVWSFVKSGFIDPPLATHFPGQVQEITLEPKYYTQVPAKAVDLNRTLLNTISKLSGNAVSPGLISPQNIDNSQEASMDLSLASDDTATRSPRAESPDLDDASSEGTVERKKIEVSEPVRRPDMEAMTWARELAQSCESIFRALNEQDRAQMAGSTQEEEFQVRLANLIPVKASLYSKRTIGEDVWLAFVLEADSTKLWLAQIPEKDCSRIRIESFHCGKCLALEFFDDEELALILSVGVGETHLATVQFAELADDLVPSPLDLNETKHGGLASLAIAISSHEPELPIARSRPLTIPKHATHPSLALNGRQGRRVACVAMGDGHEMQVFDMEGDEYGDDEGEEDIDPDMED